MRLEYFVRWVCEYCGNRGETLSDRIDVLQCDVCGDPVTEIG